MDERAVLDSIMQEAETLNDLPNCGGIESHVDTIVERQQTSRGVLAVVVTLMTKKVADTDQDIRMHQAGMQGGFSGRVLDTQVITPFLRSHNFPYMAGGSGWLTRSLEQPVPYTLEYPGRISPTEVKDAFLFIVYAVQKGRVDARDVLLRIFKGLIDFRERNSSLALSRPVALTVGQIVDRVEQHYGSGLSGAARLPVLAIYAVLKVVVAETSRYTDCELLPLEAQTAADTRTGNVGDVQIMRGGDVVYEGLEVKHDIPVSSSIVDTAYEKFRTAAVERYYILTTHATQSFEGMDGLISEIQRGHGCQVIVNGVAPTLRYYLRLLSDASLFVHEYVTLVETDNDVSYDLKIRWNELVGLD